MLSRNRVEFMGGPYDGHCQSVPSAESLADTVALPVNRNIFRMLSGYWNGGLGCSIETLAELIGDTPKVAFDHYGREWGQHYQEPLWAAVGSPGRANGKVAARRRKPSGRKRKRSLLGEKG